MSTLDDFLAASKERSAPTQRGSKERTLARERTKFTVDQDGNFKSGSRVSYNRVARDIQKARRKAVRDAQRAQKDSADSETPPTPEVAEEPRVTESEHVKNEQEGFEPVDSDGVSPPPEEGGGTTREYFVVINGTLYTEGFVCAEKNDADATYPVEVV